MMRFMKKKLLKLKIHPMQYLVLFYFLAIVVAAIFFYLPITHQEGVKVSLIDAFFIAVSAVSVTGLTVVPIHETFNTIGIMGLLFFLQVGGIGIMTLSTFVWLLSKRRIGLRERQLIMTDQNRTELSGMVNSIRNILLIFVSVEVIGTVLLTLSFLAYYPSFGQALYHGVFVAVSATTNGGFDLTGTSLIGFHDNYLVQTIVMVLIITGSVGFPVLIEVKDYVLSKKKKRYRFSLYTKLTTTIFFSLIIGGAILIGFFEWNEAFQGKMWHEIVFYSLFQSVSTRSGGLATINITVFSQVTILLMSFLMFIGASPSSVGGGIRTTTFALNLLYLYNFARGNKEVRVFRREVMQEDLNKSVAVTMMGILVCSVALVTLSHTESFPLQKILFEMMSAFGTTGLSLGVLEGLSSIGKVVFMILMFIGRIGILPTLYVLGRRKDNQKSLFRYPKEKIIIG